MDAQRQDEQLLLDRRFSILQNLVRKQRLLNFALFTNWFQVLGCYFLIILNVVASSKLN